MRLCEEEKCNNNTVTNAVNGIKVSGFRGSELKDNTVGITSDKTNNASNQYGICLEGGVGILETFDPQNPNPVQVGDGSTVLQGNKLAGPGMTINSTGILLSQQMKADIGCNQVGGLPSQSGILGFTHGFRFVGTNPQTKFWDNTMYTSNQYGMTLWDDGVIGLQGNTTPPTNATDPLLCASNNSWDQDANYWNSLGLYMTNCQGSDATKSKLVVRNSSSPGNGHINPQGSGHSDNNTIPGMTYSIADGSLLYATQPDNPNCIRCVGATPYNRSQTLLEEIADGTVSLPNDDAEERLMVMQEQLYALLMEQPELVASSNSLQQFVLNSQWSSLDYIYYAGKYLAKGDTASVQLLLDTWPGQTALDEAYSQYFEWLLRMYEEPEWRPELNTVFELANRCPLKYGTVVYAVRNLYNALTGEIHYFEGSCEGNEQAKGTNKSQGKKFIRLKQPKQQVPEIPISKGSLKLYPNPSNGIVNVQYNKMKLVMVTDMAGRVIKQLQVNGLGNLQINVQGLQKGVYLVKVINQDNESETQKLIMQ